jgi:hypothetical protein
MLAGLEASVRTSRIRDQIDQGLAHSDLAGLNFL